VAAWEAEMGFSKEQQAKQASFRSILLEEGVLQEVFDNKPALWRFLQARQWDVEKAAVMYRNHVKWRAQMELDEFVVTPQGPIPKFMLSFTLPDLMHIKNKGYQFGHHKIGFDGRPIYFDRLGAINFAECCRNTPTDDVLKYFAWTSEASIEYRTAAASVVAGKHIGKSLYIVDAKGFGLHMLTKETRNFIKAFMSIASDNYPESMYKTWVINAPFVFRTAWGIVKNMGLDPNTVAKFSIMGGEKEYMPKLLEVLRKEDIPSFCGGLDNSCDFIVEQGPWSQYLPTPLGPHTDTKSPYL